MIARTWTTAIDERGETEFLAYARTRSRAMFLEQPRCLGVLFLRGSAGIYRVCSFWEDREAIDALASSPSYQQTVQGLIGTNTLRGDASVEIYEVMGGAVQVSDWSRFLDEAGA